MTKKQYEKPLKTNMSFAEALGSLMKAKPKDTKKHSTKSASSKKKK